MREKETKKDRERESECLSYRRIIETRKPEIPTSEFREREREIQIY